MELQANHPLQAKISSNQKANNDYRSGFGSCQWRLRRGQIAVFFFKKKGRF